MDRATHDGAGTAHHRGGFTLVELLVVIGILAVLAALVTVAATRAQATAQNAAIKAEIDMLHMAIMNYKNEYGSFPPCSDDLSSNNGLATKHLQRAFPRCSTARSEMSTVLQKQGANPVAINPTNSLAFWLSGYTKDPSAPLTNGARTKLFDFDTSRVDAATGAYYPRGRSGSPYIYIDSNNYSSYPYIMSGLTQVRAQRVPNTPPATNTARDFATSTGTETTPPFANADTFQILCAGRDEVFGTDDDLSNCWPRTRREYLESLVE
ncbi:MAG: type II secretion system protein [Planctomycetia bacterium]